MFILTAGVSFYEMISLSFFKNVKHLKIFYSQYLHYLNYILHVRKYVNNFYCVYGTYIQETMALSMTEFFAAVVSPQSQGRTWHPV